MHINKLEPPYDKNGNVTPVTGINPTTTSKLSSVCRTNSIIRPKDKYFPNKSLVCNDTFIILENKVTVQFQCGGRRPLFEEVAEPESDLFPSAVLPPGRIRNVAGFDLGE